MCDSSWLVCLTISYILITQPCKILCSQELDTYQSPSINALIPSTADIQLISREWENGNVDAGAQLSFVQALGIGTDQDIGNAISLSNSLLSSGAARAYTTYALLLNHNLTETNLSENEREKKVMSNYVIAALNGDPLAQMIAGEMYYKQGDCQSAVSYHSKVSSFVIQNIPEMEVSQPTFVDYVWEEDSFLPREAFPSQDMLDFFEYMSVSENEAALKVASLLMSGASSIKRDFSKAERYLRRAVEGNSTLAMIWLAQLQLRNLIDGDDAEALMLLEKALEYGNELAHSGLGRIYMEGRAGVQKDFKKAEHHFEKGLASGNIDAYYQLGKLYAMEEGSRAAALAANVWSIPAALGHVHASWSMAEYYRTNFMEPSYRTVFTSKEDTALAPKICDLAYSHYQTVAQAGDYSDLFYEAFSDYKSGRNEAALMKYLLLSDLGYTAGHINAGRILDEGVSGIYKNEVLLRKRAFEMWSRAAKDGNPKGYVRLGDYIYYGLGEIEQNKTAAVDYYAKAYARGEPEGGFSLALAIEWGDGIQQDLLEAEKIYNTLIDKHNDAVVPASIALFRLKTFVYINDLFNINVHNELNHLSGKISLTLENFTKKVISLWYYWDYILMILLVLFILANLVFRR
ncbi:UNVERIFIED_CONTAM: hypothetical protein RMT77_009847 [Armadillidium vulgare]